MAVRLAGPPAPSSPLSPSAPPARRAERLALLGVEKRFAPRGWSPRQAAPAPLVVTARVRRGECVLACGDLAAASALLWCVAGLTHPDRGELRWLAAGGGPAAAPRRAYVPAGWRGYDCWTPRDALEAAVPAGRPQRAADRRLAHVGRLCLLAADDRVRLGALGAAPRWLVGVAAAVAGGADWLLLQPPPAEAAGDHRLVRRVLRRLHATGHTLLVAAEEGAAACLPPAHRVLPLTAEGPATGVHWRVAELAALPEAAARALPSVDPSPGAP